MLNWDFCREFLQKGDRHRVVREHAASRRFVRRWNFGATLTLLSARTEARTRGLHLSDDLPRRAADKKRPAISGAFFILWMYYNVR